LTRRIEATAGRRRWAVLTRAAVAVALAVGAGAAAAQESSNGVTIKMNRLYNDSGKGRVMVTVTNETRDTLDVDVTCEFLRQKVPVARGSNSASRVQPFRTDTISVTSSRAQEFDSARCKIDNVQK
jgi:hypothetical protein